MGLRRNALPHHRPSTGVGHEKTNPPTSRWRFHGGDSRIGNIMYGEDLLVKAVMDWEMATLASPKWIWGIGSRATRAFSFGYGYPLPPGFPSEEETVARYEELSGYKTRYVLFYQAFSGIRISITLLRVVRQMIESGVAPPDTNLINNNPMSRTLAATLDLSPPEGSDAKLMFNQSK